MQVLLLGPLELRDGDTVVELRGARLRALLTRLALDAGRTVSVEALALALWDDEVPADETNAVQSLVSRLRRALPDPSLVESRPGGYRLRLGADDVDVLRFRELSRRARDAARSGDEPDAARLREQALALWRGPALADQLDAPYAAAQAVALDGERRALDEDRIAAALEAGRGAEVIGELTALVAADPLHEPAVALLMRAQYDLGRPADALRSYDTLRTGLAEALGTDPSPGLQALHLELLRGERTPPAEAPAPARSRLPAPLTSFLGREQELTRLEQLLRTERLVTLVGPGGTGKTRLAVETATRLDRVAVTLVELAPVSDPADIAQAILDALDLRQQRALDANRYPRLDARTRIVDGLEAAQHVLLLDNCEHLVEGVATFVADLLTHCPLLQVLATSREPLAITGEVVFPVPTLARPAVDATVEQAGQAAAVRLFLDRARAASPGFVLDERNTPGVVELCRRLDGLPLAIELAAARLRSLTVDQIAARLDDRFRLLTGGSRAAVARHRTLRAVVEWSWGLLDDNERALAERFAVFTGGATVDAAHAVCLGPGTSPTDAEDALARLADKSLLQLVDGGPEPRYRMLETLREYGAERLDDELPVVRRAHASYFRDLAEQLEPTLRTGEQVATIARLEAERDNLLSALRFSVDAEDADTAMRIAAALGWYWLISDGHAEAATWCSAALAVPGSSDPQTTALVTGLHLVNAIAAEMIPFTDRAQIEAAFRAIPDVDRTASHPLLALLDPAEAFLSDPVGDWAGAIETALHHPDPWAKGALHLLRAQVNENAGAADAHRTDIAVALEYFRATGDRWGIATCLHGTGDGCLLADQLDQARDAYEEARGLFAELAVGTSDEVQLLLGLATVEHRSGNSALAEVLVGRAAAVASSSGSRPAAAMAAIARTALRLDDGDPAGAAVSVGCAQSLLTGAKGVAPQLHALLRGVQAHVALAEAQEPEQLRDLLREALGFARSSYDMPVTSFVTEAAAALTLALGNPTDAARLLGAAAAMRGVGERAAAHGGLASLDPMVAALTARTVEAIGADGFTRCYRELAVATPQDAAAYVVGLIGVPD